MNELRWRVRLGVVSTLVYSCAFVIVVQQAFMAWVASQRKKDNRDKLQPGEECILTDASPRDL